MPFAADFHTLTLPDRWRGLLLDLYRHGKGNPGRIRSVPIRRFRELLRAVTPELLAMSWDLAPGDDEPTLYTASPFPPGVIGALVNAWAADLPSGAARRSGSA